MKRKQSRIYKVTNLTNGQVRLIHANNVWQATEYAARNVYFSCEVCSVDDAIDLGKHTAVEHAVK